MTLYEKRALRKLLRFVEGMEDGQGVVVSRHRWHKVLSSYASLRFCRGCGYEKCGVCEKPSPSGQEKVELQECGHPITSVERDIDGENTADFCSECAQEKGQGEG